MVWRLPEVSMYLNSSCPGRSWHCWTMRARRRSVIDSALAAEAEEQLRALDLNMALAQGGEAEGAVLARVLVVAHADQRLVEQHHHGGENLAPREIPRAQIALHALADLGEGLAELEHAAELRLVARLAVQGMVAILLAAARVARSRLDVPFGVRAYPDFGPGRGNRERVDPLALRLARDAHPVRRVVNPALSRALAPDAGEAVGDVVEPGAEGRLAMLVDARRDHRVSPSQDGRCRTFRKCAAPCWNRSARRAAAGRVRCSSTALPRGAAGRCTTGNTTRTRPRRPPAGCARSPGTRCQPR